MWFFPLFPIFPCFGNQVSPEHEEGKATNINHQKSSTSLILHNEKYKSTHFYDTAAIDVKTPNSGNFTLVIYKIQKGSTIIALHRERLFPLSIHLLMM